MTSSYRENGIAALKTVLADIKDIKQIEQHVYTSDEATYNDNLYQIIGDILEGKTVKDLLKTKKVGWEHAGFKSMVDRIAEQNDFIKNPFEVEEGVFQCKVCGSRRVYSYSRQDRSSDEGCSVYAQCIACKTKWRERG